MTNLHIQKTYQRSHEPIVWSLFGAGGMVLAYLTPALVIITGFLLPLLAGSEPEATFVLVREFLQGWFAKIAVLAIISLQLYHAVHRIYHGLHDIHVHGPEILMLIIFYGGATVLTVLTAGWLLVI